LKKSSNHAPLYITFTVIIIIIIIVTDIAVKTTATDFMQEQIMGETKLLI
jgi:hypothetical protein